MADAMTARAARQRAKAAPGTGERASAAARPTAARKSAAADDKSPAAEQKRLAAALLSEDEPKPARRRAKMPPEAPAKGAKSRQAAALLSGDEPKPARRREKKPSEAPAKETKSRQAAALLSVDEPKPARSRAKKLSEAPAKETKSRQAAALLSGDEPKPARSRAKKPPEAPAKGAKSRPSKAGGSAKPSAKKSSGTSRRKKGKPDAYDEWLEAGERSPRRPEKRRPRRSGVTVALLTGILSILVLFAWQTTQYRTFQAMKQAVAQGSFYQGTLVENVDVSGWTLAEALSYWEREIEPGYRDRTVTLDNGAAFTAGELGYSSDYQTVLTNAWSAGRSGSLEERYQALTMRQDAPASYVVSRVPWRPESLDACVSAIATQIDRPAVDAKLDSFDADTFAFTFTDEVPGSQLDRQALRQDMEAALNAGGGAVTMRVLSVEPGRKKADIAGEYGMIAAAVTNASSSSGNRLNNIGLALSIINGTALEPGQQFSFNGVVGKRTTDRGFKVAAAYNSGTVTQEVGGGICQVSTTLFNAAVKADMQIDERHNHSLTVSYVDRGKDATVDWGNQDFKFTNTSSDRVYICCALDGSKRVRIGIFGRLLPNGESITVEARTTGTIDFETVYQPNPAYPSGATAVVQEGKPGYTAEAYKVRWDADGNQIASEFLCSSRYRATNQIIEFGP